MQHLYASHTQDSRKHILGRARHEHMVVCFPPLNVQRAAWQVHPVHTPSAMMSVAHTYCCVERALACARINVHRACWTRAYAHTNALHVMVSKKVA